MISKQVLAGLAAITFAALAACSGDATDGGGYGAGGPLSRRATSDPTMGDGTGNQNMAAQPAAVPSSASTSTQPATGPVIKPGGGGMPPAAPAGATAKAFYEQNVDPQLEASCGSCHATGANSAPIFLVAASPDAAYMKITSGVVAGILAQPANSMLILHGAHTGPALTSTQQMLVSQWLSIEVMERHLGGSSGAPTITVQAAITAFGQCMSLDDFEDNSTGAAVSDLPRAQTQAGPCNGCHNAGDGGFWASGGNVGGVDQRTIMFQKSQTMPYIKKYITGTVDANGNFAGLQASNAIRTKSSVAQDCVGPDCHPKFNLQPELAQAIDSFVTKTLAKGPQCSGMAPAPAGTGTTTTPATTP
jgi:hypothetical protein